MPGQQAEGAQQGVEWTSLFWRVALVFLVLNYLVPSLTSTPRPITDGKDNKDASTTPVAAPGTYTCLHKAGDAMHLTVFLIESDLKSPGTETVLLRKQVTLGSFNAEEYLSTELHIPLSTHLLNNGSASICSVMSVAPVTEDFATIASQPNDAARFYRCNPMVEYHLQNKFIQRQNLITGEMDTPDLSKEAASETAERKVISFWKPNVTLSVVDMLSGFTEKTLPPQLKKHFYFDASGKQYFPIVYYNEFWLLHEHLMPINDTLAHLPLTISVEPIGQTKFMLYESMIESFSMQKQFGSSNKEIDDVKLMLLETNPWLLGLTVVVSLLHTVFDVLAFKNDISYWKNKKSMEGMSVRSIFMNTIAQVIIFLYLLDNETSLMILFSVGVGVLIEFWKITKAVNVQVDRSGLIPRIRFEDKESYSSVTKEYDDLAYRYLSYLLFPLVIGYAVYSLYYETHRSWYSWVLASLTGCVYTFGFIMMTPQLFINYKLKSVAHLPWRTFTYKVLNTFIDDLFAFIIRMPTLHRLACFRDDIVFFILLFQWYCYPKDKRRNEYGEFVEDEKEDKDKDSTEDDSDEEEEEEEETEKEQLPAKEEKNSARRRKPQAQ